MAVCRMMLSCLGLALVVGHVMAKCTVPDVNICTENLPAIRLGVEIIPDLSPSQLTQSCTEWSQVEPCLDEIEIACETTNTSSISVEVMQKINEERAGYGFICDSSNEQIYINDLRPCIKKENETVTAAGTECKSTYNEQIWYLDKTNPLNRYKFCKAAKDYLYCVTEAGEEHCSSNAAAPWIRLFHEGLWAPHRNALECSSDGGMEVGAIVIVALCAGSSVYCVFFISLSFSKDSDKCKSCTSTVLKKKSRGGTYELQKQQSV